MPELITLNQESTAIQYLCKKDKRLAKVISLVGDITYEPHENAYAFLIHEIIEQMLSIKAGKKIFDRLDTLCNGDISPSVVAKLSEAEIRSTGTSTAKTQYIKNVTAAVNSGELNFEELSQMTDEEVRKKMTSIRGIGNWTAKMYLIFVLNRQDILPFEDGAFLQSYRWLYNTDDCSPESIKKRCAKWKPYSSIAARYLYRVLDLGMTKDKFHLFKQGGK